MKIINVEYMTNGNYIENYDKPYVIDDESGVCVKATFPQGENGSVRAYIGGSGSGDVVDCGTVSGSSRTAQVVLTDDNLACGFVTIGFEINTGSMSIRYRPLKLKVNPFIDITGSNPHGYTVTVSVGSVSSLPSGSEPTVENTGTSKDVILNFGIPKGEKGDKGDMPEVVDNLTSTDTTAALSANQGKVLDGKKVDKVDGKGLSANDFTDAHKAVVSKFQWYPEYDYLLTGYDIHTGYILVESDLDATGNINSDTEVSVSVNGKKVHNLSKKADKLMAVPHTTLSGYPISVTDHLENEPLIDYKIYGNSVQDGTPSPDNPIEIQSVGDLVTNTSSQYYGKYAVPVSVNGKNLIPYPFSNTTKTINGVTFTDNGDGSITVNGTATADTTFIAVSGNTTKVSYGSGSYVFSGCPAGGSKSTYCVNCAAASSKSGSYNLVDDYDFGNGKMFSAPNGINRIYFAIRIMPNTTCNNLIFKPQLELGETATEYEPYTSETKHIYLDEPLRKVGDYADYVEYSNKKAVRQIEVLDDTGTKTITESYGVLSEPTTEPIAAPEFASPSADAMNVFALTAVLPSKIDMTYYQDINKVISDLKNSILSQGGNA